MRRIGEVIAIETASTMQITSVLYSGSTEMAAATVITTADESGVEIGTEPTIATEIEAACSWLQDLTSILDSTPTMDNRVSTADPGAVLTLSRNREVSAMD